LKAAALPEAANRHARHQTCRWSAKYRSGRQPLVERANQGAIRATRHVERYESPPRQRYANMLQRSWRRVANALNAARKQTHATGSQRGSRRRPCPGRQQNSSAKEWWKARRRNARQPSSARCGWRAASNAECRNQPTATRVGRTSNAPRQVERRWSVRSALRNVVQHKIDITIERSFWR